MATFEPKATAEQVRRAKVGTTLDDALAALDHALEAVKSIRGGDPGHVLKGVKDVAIYGQQVTKSLRHLRDLVTDFDEGWKIDSTELRQSPLGRYFKELRNELEHGGQPSLAHFTTGINGGGSFSTADMPEGFTGMRGGVEGWFWTRALPDGSEEWKEVELPPNVVERHIFTDLPKASVPAEYVRVAVDVCCAHYVEMLQVAYERTLQRHQPGAQIVGRTFTR